MLPARGLRIDYIQSLGEPQDVQFDKEVDPEVPIRYSTIYVIYV